MRQRYLTKMFTAIGELSKGFLIELFISKKWERSLNTTHFVHVWGDGVCCRHARLLTISKKFLKLTKIISQKWAAFDRFWKFIKWIVQMSSNYRKETRARIFTENCIACYSRRNEWCLDSKRKICAPLSQSTFSVYSTSHQEMDRQWRVVSFCNEANPMLLREQKRSSQR